MMHSNIVLPPWNKLESSHCPFPALWASCRISYMDHCPCLCSLAHFSLPHPGPSPWGLPWWTYHTAPSHQEPPAMATCEWWCQLGKEHSGIRQSVTSAASIHSRFFPKAELQPQGPTLVLASHSPGPSLLALGYLHGSTRMPHQHV